MTESQQPENAPYSVLARKYRPASFDDLIGQAPMVTTLTNAFRTGRIAQAYMLTGVRGVGKTTTARILARALNYKRADINAPTIDMRVEGEHCRAIQEGRHVDVIEMDAASHTGIDDIRDIIESAQYAPAIARYKVYIIDEVHMLSRSAFNGLLKTLEEPPSHLKFIFATTEIRKVPVTVLSRCQRFDLRRVESSVLCQHLTKISAAEDVSAEGDALAMIARAAEGSVRDALSILDQAISHNAGRVDAAGLREMLGLADRARIIDLFEHVMKGDITAALAELQDLYTTGADPASVLTDFADFVHFVTKLKFTPQSAADPSLAQAERERGAFFAQSLSVRVLGRAWQILIKGIAEIQASERPLAAADMVLVRLTHASCLPGPDELIRTLRDEAGAATQSTVTTEEPAASARHVEPVSRPQSAPATSRVPAAPAISAAHSNPAGAEYGGPSRHRGSESPSPLASGSELAPVNILRSFEEIILLAEERRDIKMRTLLRKNVRLVSFADSRMEINLAGDPPPDFLPELGRRLLEWTGRRWTIAVSREGGQPSIEESERAEAGALVDSAREDPTVKAIIDRFPGARIVDVKLRTEEPESMFGSEDVPPDDERLEDCF
jgi:DNA polymerase III subunit gamma/tau